MRLVRVPRVEDVGEPAELGPVDTPRALCRVGKACLCAERVDVISGDQLDEVRNRALVPGRLRGQEPVEEAQVLGDGAIWDDELLAGGQGGRNTSLAASVARASREVGTRERSRASSSGPVTPVSVRSREGGAIANALVIVLFGRGGDRGGRHAIARGMGHGPFGATS